MQIIEVQEWTPELMAQLLTVLKSSVRATHLFLTEGEILRIRDYVPQALNGVWPIWGSRSKTAVPRPLWV